MATEEDDQYYLTKCTFEQLQGTRKYQSEWVQKCTEGMEMKDALQKGNLENMKWIWNQKKKWEAIDCVDELFPLAAKMGYFEILKWLHEIKCPEGINIRDEFAGSSAFSMAAKTGSLEMMKWLNDHGYEWDENTFDYAAVNGSLENMMWLKESGCNWNEDTCYCILRHGNLQNVIWSKQNGFVFDEYSYVAAAEAGNLKVMQWLHEQGVPMNAKCFEMAAQQGNIKMMQWLKAHHCPVNKETLKYAIFHMHQMKKWLNDNGCPETL